VFGAVYFDTYLEFVAVEVQHIRPNRMLSTKLVANGSIPNGLPYRRLSDGLAVA